MYPKNPDNRLASTVRVALTGALLTAGLAFGSAAQASLAFTFDYSGNTADVGFLDPLEGTARQTALTTAGSLFSSLFGSHFSNMGTIDLAVTSTDDGSSGTLASAGSSVVSTCSPPGGCVVTEVVKTKLLSNGATDANGAAADGSVDVNWGWDWQLDPNAAVNPATEFDFFAAIFHEFTHALGFSSGISEGGAGYFNDEWTQFDIFLQNASGTSIIDNAFFINQSEWDAAKVGGTGNGLFFAGPNAIAANGGNPVAIYSPLSWEDGSSGSHLDKAVFPTDMMKHDRDFGPETRTYSAVEVGILQDLGYRPNPTNNIPEPGTLALLLAGLAGAVARRRKA